MYNFFKKVISSVAPWGSESEVNDLSEEEEKIINSIKCMSTDSEEIPVNKSQQKPCGQSDDTVDFDVETYQMLHKSGKITHLCDEFGIIDQVLYFEPHQVSPGLKLNLFDEVVYSTYIAKENETFRINKVHSLKSDTWEHVGVANSEPKPDDFPKVEEISALSRVVTGRVTQRRGREVFVDSANVWCHLDKIESTYVPVEGDWVELQAVVSICEKTADLTGDVLEVKSLKPLLTKNGLGRVTFWSDNKKEGAIENLIYFTTFPCEKGYIPNLGDEVLYEAVESDQENYRWRAVKVVFINSRKETETMSVNTSSKSADSKDSGNKNDILIIPSVCAIEVELNQTKNVILEVKNDGTAPQYLRHTKFNRKRNSQLVLLNPKNSNNVCIKPKQTVQFEFECKGKTLGLSREIFHFYFKNFTIERKFEITVVGDKEMNRFLNCKFDTVFEVFNSKTYYKSTIEPDIVLYGPRPWKPPRFISKERRCVFKIPPRLKKIMTKSSGSKVLKNLTEYAPYLKKGLNFDTYSDWFHTLLYLEEIELKINFGKYDLTEVFLGRSDAYFVLEVPGLVERRPSLIVGDRVVLNQSWQDGGKVKHIGFVHFINAKDIYVKFHSSFHDTYNESECDISFEPNTSFFAKCHESVNRAIKTLGKNWLFPSSVNEKPPIIEFEVPDDVKENPEYVVNKSILTSSKKTNDKLETCEVETNQKCSKDIPIKKNLVWVNRNLNARQKLAVINVLEGRGRPLPYIIFGPPGTGKTITLVEIIIQIYRLMPESRILITTPSNSSADLICERLIESGNFKPGQLVRLVALYRVIEGLVPSKLIPYSTYFTAKTNGKGIPELYTKTQIKGLTSTELAGRHRITVSTCVTIGLLHYLGLPPDHFTHIIVDEAGQTSEPEILISTTFQNTRSGQVVLTGDPQQLGPVICSNFAKSYGLGVSLLQRLISTFPYARDFEGFPNTSGFDPRFITKLNVNYRSVPEILTLPSQLFYNSDLIPTVSESDSKEADIISKFNFEIEGREKAPAIIFHGLIGQNHRENDSPSWFNPHEIWQVVFYIKRLYSIGLNKTDIGIVTPYSKQVQKLRNLLPSLDLAVPKIGSVEEFQGQERLVVIVSTVRSSEKHVRSDLIHSLGFVASPQRLNVALTRARALLIIIGNPVLLSKDPYWVSVVNYCLKNNSYTGCSIDTFKENLETNLLKDEPEEMLGPLADD